MPLPPWPRHRRKPAASARAFLDRPREEWNWRLLIRIPESVSERDFDAVKDEVSLRRKGTDYSGVKLERVAFGRCVQVLHVGPYATEPATIEKLHEFISSRGLVARGRHCETYLSDPRRTAPEKIRTVLRQPVADRH